MKIPEHLRNLLVTTYEIKESPYRFGKVIDIYNGFSYINHLMNADHIFINVGKLLSREDEIFINSYDNIFCSIHKRGHFKRLKVNKNWIFGGPAAFELTDNIENIKVFDMPFEHYLGERELSSTFDFYWRDVDFTEVDDPKKHIVRFACSLGFGGCYWNNCIFCVYTYQKKYMERGRIEKILSSFPEETKYKSAIVFFSINSIPLAQLKILVNYAKDLQEKNYHIQTFLRLDEELIDYLLSIELKVNNFTFRIGLESFSQKTLDILNKNISIKTFIKSLKLVEKGFKVNYNLLRRFNFTDKECYEEAKQVVKEIPDSKLIMFSFWENIHWRKHNKQAMEKLVHGHGGRIQIISGLSDSYLIIPSETASYYNEKICELYDNLPHLKVYFDNYIDKS